MLLFVIKAPNGYICAKKIRLSPDRIRVRTVVRMAGGSGKEPCKGCIYCLLLPVRCVLPVCFSGRIGCFPHDGINVAS